MNSGISLEMYKQYFSSTEEEQKELLSESKGYTYQDKTTNPNTKVYTTADVPEFSSERFVAEGNIDNIDQLGEVLRILLNAAWGTDWGELSPEFARSEDAESIKLPQITFDINNREIADKNPLKPQLTDTIIEVVDGIKTGDAFNVYRQWFDCIVEFNFWGKTTLEARRLMDRFESLMGVYSGLLEKLGVSKIFFLKELSPRQSVWFIEGIPMRCLVYYVRLEKINTVRHSILKNVEISFDTMVKGNL